MKLIPTMPIIKQKTMDLTTRAQRMKRLPPVTLKDYAVPIAQAVVALPFIYGFVVIYSIILK
jgi:hypothetical protein